MDESVRSRKDFQKEILKVLDYIFTNTNEDVHNEIIQKAEKVVINNQKGMNKAIAQNRALESCDQELSELSPQSDVDIRQMIETKCSDVKSTKDTAFIDQFRELIQDRTEIITESTDTQVHIDVFTKQPIKIGVRSKTCNHLFEKKIIMNELEVVGKKNKKIRCPHMGCVQTLSKKDFDFDDEIHL